MKTDNFDVFKKFMMFGENPIPPPPLPVIINKWGELNANGITWGYLNTNNKTWEDLQGGIEV